jgi:hypothetical protein
MPSGLTRGQLSIFPHDKREALARRSCVAEREGISPSQRPSEKALKIKVFRTATEGCVYRECVPDFRAVASRSSPARSD